LYGDLVLAPDGNFYGFAIFGGANGLGTVYRVTPDGQLTVLASLDSTLTQGWSESKLTVGEDGNFYGVFGQGGASGLGVLYRVTPSGNLTVLVDFAAVQGVGVYPANVLVPAPGGGFYGITNDPFTPSIYHVDLSGNVQFMDYLPGFDGGGGLSLVSATNGTYYGVMSQGGSSDIGYIFRWTP